MDLARLQVSTASGGKPGVVVKRLSGKLALETVHNFLAEQRGENTPHLVLDLSGVSFLDSAGVGALVQLFVHRRNLGQTLALAALTKQAKAVMEVSGLVKLLPIYESVELAASEASAAARA